MARSRTAIAEQSFVLELFFDDVTICHIQSDCLRYDLCAINAPFP